MNFFAIGDIHGSLKQLTTLHTKILTNEKFKPKEDVVIYLGDYIDRGLKSKQVIDQIIKLKNKTLNTICLMGNHDQFLIDFLFENNNNVKNWLNFGADQTFKSYDVEVVDYIKDGFDDHIIQKLRKALLLNMSTAHINFFKNLKISHSSEKYLFVHAGIDPKKNLTDQTKVDFLWSRSEDFFNKDFKADKIIVHGHTPEESIVNHTYRINIDTGCYFSGKLSCVLLNDINDHREFIDSN